MEEKLNNYSLLLISETLKQRDNVWWEYCVLFQFTFHTLGHSVKFDNDLQSKGTLTDVYSC